MPTFNITAPDGRKFRVTGDNAEGALAALQQHLGTGANTGEQFAAAFDTSNDRPDIASALKQKTEAPLGWGGVASQAASNFGPSAKQFGSDILSVIAHPIDTVSNLGKVIAGAAEKIIPGQQSHEPYADAIGKFFADRYGGLDNIKHTIATDPVGFLSDVSTVFSGGALAGARAPGLAGTVGRIAGTVGRTIDPVNAALKGAGAVAKTAGKIAAIPVGLATGAGATPLRLAAKAGFEGGTMGKAFTSQMRAGASAESVIADAKAAVGAIKAQREAAYRAGMADLSKDRTVLDFRKIDRAIANARPVAEFRGPRTGIAVSLEPSAAKTAGDVAEVLDQWRNLPADDFHTPEGLDALKQRIGDIRSGTEPGSASEKIATQVYNVVKGQILAQAPAYARTMEGYQKASDLIREMEKTLSLNRSASIDTQLRKLQSVMRNNVNTNYGKRADLVKILEDNGATNVMAKLAGQSLSSAEPRGLSRIIAGANIVATPAAAVTNPAMLPLMGGALIASSPRLMGEAAYAAGKIAKGAKKLPLRPAIGGGYQSGRAKRKALELTVPVPAR